MSFKNAIISAVDGGLVGQDQNTNINVNNMTRFGDGFYYDVKHDSQGEYTSIYKAMKISGQIKKVIEVRYDTRINDYKIKFMEWSSFASLNSFFVTAQEIMKHTKRLG